MTEDVLEQVVDDWLRRQGYFTRTNVRFGPGKDDEGYDSTAHNQQTDLDVLAIRPATAPRPESVLAITGTTEFTFVLAVTRLGPGGTADTTCWHDHPVVGQNLGDTPGKVLTFKTMWDALSIEVTATSEPSHVGRLAQLLKASQLDG